MSGNGNGVDLAAVYGAVLALSAELRTIKAEQRAQNAKLDNLAGQVATLRGEVASYHGSVVGHRRRRSPGGMSAEPTGAC